VARDRKTTGAGILPVFAMTTGFVVTTVTDGKNDELRSFPVPLASRTALILNTAGVASSC
jgi:hypothetical protein